MNTLYRPREGRIIGGVCAGLARRFGLGAWTVRLLAILSCLLPGPQVVVYIALWILMPDERAYFASAPGAPAGPPDPDGRPDSAP